MSIHHKRLKSALIRVKKGLTNVGALLLAAVTHCQPRARKGASAA
jgi:hypothetical protein